MGALKKNPGGFVNGDFLAKIKFLHFETFSITNHLLKFIMFKILTVIFIFLFGVVAPACSTSVYLCLSFGTTSLIYSGESGWFARLSCTPLPFDPEQVWAV